MVMKNYLHSIISSRVPRSYVVLVGSCWDLWAGKSRVKEIISIGCICHSSAYKSYKQPHSHDLALILSRNLSKVDNKSNCQAYKSDSNPDKTSIRGNSHLEALHDPAKQDSIRQCCCVELEQLFVVWFLSRLDKTVAATASKKTFARIPWRIAGMPPF